VILQSRIVRIEVTSRIFQYLLTALGLSFIVCVLVIVVATVSGMLTGDEQKPLRIRLKESSPNALRVARIAGGYAKWIFIVTLILALIYIGFSGASEFR